MTSAVALGRNLLGGGGVFRRESNHSFLLIVWGGGGRGGVGGIGCAGGRGGVGLVLTEIIIGGGGMSFSWAERLTSRDFVILLSFPKRANQRAYLFFVFAASSISIPFNPCFCLSFGSKKFLHVARNLFLASIATVAPNTKRLNGLVQEAAILYFSARDTIRLSVKSSGLMVA